MFEFPCHTWKEMTWYRDLALDTLGGELTVQ